MTDERAPGSPGLPDATLVDLPRTAVAGDGALAVDTPERPALVGPDAPAPGFFSIDAAAATIAKPVTFVRRFVDKYAPWLSLALGIVSRILFKHEIDFAPKAVALLLLAWTLPAIVARVLPDPSAGAHEAAWRRLARTTGAPFIVVVLYKNVLFFLTPLWFGAAHFPSLNMGAPLVLAAMALATCFSGWYHHQIIDHPVRRVVWSAVVLFAALVPATAVLALTSPRVSLFLAALASTAAATAALKGGEGESILSRRALTSLLLGATPVAVLVVIAAPLLPPVPAASLDKGAGTGIVSRNLVGRAEAFPRGVRRVYAWFAVSLPNRYRQTVTYRWYRDGHEVGAPVTQTIEGGRASGFRTANWKPVPAIGRWRVDLSNEMGQLIDRVRFEVRPEPPPIAAPAPPAPAAPLPAAPSPPDP
ncbi:MAG TPA: DUF2914 domain-containing protein [Polyangia bacterium]